MTTRSDFELFAEDAAGYRLPVYGRQLFDNVPTTFAPVDRIPVPANYALGPGDELLIRVWGKIDLDARVTVDRNGQIFLPKVGTISVAGLRYEQLEGYLRSAIGGLYKDFELNVTMGQLRSIQIFVLGSARQPGAYTVSSLSTLVNALFASGGPSATGSMRKIQLRRGDRLVTEFDIYDLLREGDKSHDVQLLPEDVIFISPVGPQVAIIGSVNEPGIYEMKGETAIASALKDAGGLANLAGLDRVLLERIENHRRRRVDEFALDSSGLQRVLGDGDLLRIFPISPQFDNAVMLRGSVAQPGRYGWHEGMRVSDLIPSRDFLITRDYWNQQNHLVRERAGHQFADPNRQAANLRTNIEKNQSANSRTDTDQDQSANSRTDADQDQSANSRTNTDQDQSANSRTNTDQDQSGNSRTGAGRYQSANLHTDIMTDITQNSAEINWDYAAIERLDEHDLSTRLIAFNLSNAIDNPASSDNQPLKSGDIITIFSRKDLPLPMEKHETFVRVAGEVNAPGVYRVNPGQTLRDVVEQAGGLTSHSYLYASQLTRISTRLAQEEELRQSTDRLRTELLSRFATAPSLPGTNAQDQGGQLAAQEALITQVSAIRPTGRIILDMKPDASAVADIPAFPLEDGDSFDVPPKLSTIQVIGEAYNQNAFRFQNRKPLYAYLNDAGGPTREADVRRIFLIRADGTVISRQSHRRLWEGNFEKLIPLPGDAIIVPRKLATPGGFWQQMPAVTQILSQAAVMGAVLATLH